MPAISALSDLSTAVVSSGATIQSSWANTAWTNADTGVNNLNDVVADLEKNYASASAPTDKPEGKIWCDITNDPAQLKFYKDGASNLYIVASLEAANVFTGINSFPDGSAAAPSLTNTGDTDTGFFFPAANAIGFAAFGVEPVRITVTTNLTDAVVAILSTEESTSPTTGALTVGDGLGVAGAMWVGGLANFADLVYIGGSTVPAGSPAKELILETGAVLGTAATGFTQIGHVATDALNITVGETATGYVKINNTLNATSLTAGALVVAGGTAIAGNIYASRLFIQTAGGAPYNINAEAYTTTVGSAPTLAIRKSQNATIGTLTDTIDTDVLGIISFEGVDTAQSFVRGTAIRVRQRGVAAAGSVPADMEFMISSLIRAGVSNEGNFFIGTSVLTATDAVHALLIAGGTPPTAAVTNGIAMYAKDEAGAGTRTPHFFLEAGGIVKIPSVATAHDIVISDGGTGGVGSGGAGNQYIEIQVGSTVYKVLHDGTV